MTPDEELLTSSLRMLGDGGLNDSDLDRRVSKFQDALCRLRDDPAEATRIDALALEAEPGRSAMRAADWRGEDRSVALEPNPSAVPRAGRIVIIMPTYNERQNLESITSRVRMALPAADLLIVDDNSPDGTGDLADKLAEWDHHVQVIHRTEKAGLGRAYIAGFGWALERGYDVIVEMDADGSHRPEHLPSLVGALDRADLSIGSRWVRGGRVVNWSKSREALSRLANLYTRLMLDLSVRDAAAGFRAYRADTLRMINLARVESTGYSFQIDLTVRVALAGLRIVEIPITFVEREHGASKMSNSITLEAFWQVAHRGTRRRLRQLHSRAGFISHPQKR